MIASDRRVSRELIMSRDRTTNRTKDVAPAEATLNAVLADGGELEIVTEYGEPIATAFEKTEGAERGSAN